MARKITLGNTAPQVGNKVSHSNRKTKRKWMVNGQRKAFYSTTLGRSIRVNLPASAIRTVDFHGGLDEYLLSEKSEHLPPNARRLQAVLRSRSIQPAAAA
ncbi:MAG: 50S ribosomal protein L28 [Magnetococcus sp. WYHC-3]